VSAPLRAIYTLGQLAQMAGISAWRVARTLESNGVLIRRSGRTRVVALGDLRRGLPWLWEGILEREATASCQRRDR
jgi:hypothetical protein